MLEYKDIEEGAGGNSEVRRPEEMRLIKDQWIPDIESVLSDIDDEAERKNAEEELAKIKTDFALLEHADFGNETVMMQVKALHDRVQTLFGNITLRFEEKEEAV